jgi:peptidoglycan glycosyltransferase
MPDPYVVRDVRAHSDTGRPSDTVLDRFASGGGTRVVSQAAATAMRAAMVDAVNGELGRLYAGQGDITLYGISGSVSAGKTGTAELGGQQAPHSWFIGFAPAQEGAAPSIAVAVLVESGGSGSGRAAPIAGRVMAEYLRMTGGN